MSDRSRADRESVSEPTAHAARAAAGMERPHPRRGSPARGRPRSRSAAARGANPRPPGFGADVDAATLDPDAPIDTAAAERERRELFAALLADEPFQDEEPEPSDGPSPHVTAVLVAHNGARWLPTTLAALRVQTRPPEQVVAIDTGSDDDSPRLLTRALGTTRLVTAPVDTSYGSAIDTALAAVEVSAADRAQRREWIWLLHDDSAPAPEALERLLAHAVRNPSVSVLGAKAVDWDRPDRLVDIGQSTDAGGHRETYLDPGEIDQGQHEEPRDVLAVGTAGALVRRETWDALHGFDPRLPLLREDIDFGWRAARSGRRVAIVPTAEVRHARATLTGHRDGALVHGTGLRTDRAHAIYVSLLDGGSLGGLGRYPRALVTLVLRALVLLLTRRPKEAYEELRAGLHVLARPGRLLAGRRWRRGQFTLPARSTRPLLSRSSTRLRAVLLATTDRVTGSGELAASASASSLDSDEALPDGDANVLHRLFIRPVVGLAIVLVLVAVVADRHLLQGGALSGGRLLPVDGGVRDLWRAYGSGWHEVGAGSSSAASPWLPLLAVVSLPFGGNPAAVLTVLLLGAVPLAGLSAWYALRRRGLTTGLRLWAAATYAVLPVVTETVNAGRFDALVAVIALPLLLSSGVRLLRGDAGRASNHAFALGLGIALTAAFSPPVWLLAAVLLLGGALVGLPRGGELDTARRVERLRRLRAAVLALLVAPFVLLPWSLSLFAHPRPLLVGLGGPGGLAAVSGRALGAPGVVLLDPGGAHAPPLWLLTPLLAAALAATVRPSRSRAAATALGAAAVGMLGALAAARVGATASGLPPQGWAGVGLAVASVAVVLGTLLAAHDGRRALRSASFGLRQPVVVILVGLCAAVPLVAAGWLVAHGSGGPLGRASSSVGLPAIIVDDAASDPGQRVLTLRAVDGRVGYALGPVDGPRLGDEDLRQSPAAAALLAHLVADLASDRGTDAAETLSTFHVRYVAVDQDAAGDLPGILDEQPALTPYALPGEARLWQVLAPSSRLAILSGAVATEALNPASDTAPLGRGPTLAQLQAAPELALASGAQGAHDTVAAASGPRVLVLADSQTGDWRASLNGHALAPVTAWGWAQGFTLPAGDGGALTVSYDAGSRDTGLWFQLLAVFVAVVLAAPGTQRIEDEPAGPVATTLNSDEMWSLEDLEELAVPPAPVRGTDPEATAQRPRPRPDTTAGRERR
jgi:GT2 family glycosyltransferase